MNEKEILERLRDQTVALDIEGVEKACKDALSARVSPIKALTNGMAKGMEIVGEKYETGEYFLSELIMAAEVMKAGVKILEPHLKEAERIRKGRVVIGTVEGDLHDIGKNIVSTLLESAGFEVIDLGTDVLAKNFVEATREKKPKILGMSALLTTTMRAMEATIKELERTRLRKSVKVIIGGAPITRSYAQKIGADAAGKDAVDGVNICKSWVTA